MDLVYALGGLVLKALPFTIVAGWIALIVIGVVAGNREQRNRPRQALPNETIDGKEFSGHTEQRPLVREVTTGRIGIAMERGAAPGWIRVQFIRKSDGVAGRVEWRRQSKFQPIGKCDLDFLTHRVGRFRKERLVRYRIDKAYLARAPSGRTVRDRST